MLEKNSNNFRDMYAELGINIDKLGCIMLDLDGSSVPKPDDSILYTTTNPDRFWIKGFVAGHTPHVTLLYGLLKSGNTEWRTYVDRMLEGWVLPKVEVDHIGYFDSPYSDEPYYCIVAHLKMTGELVEGHKRLEFLPHINTFPQYKAHITIAYVKKDEAIRDGALKFYNNILSGFSFKPLKINYGK